MNPLNLLKVFFLSILWLFLFTQNTFAQSMQETTYTNPKCADVPWCYSSYGKYPIGFLATFTQTEKDDNLKYFCQKMTNNQDVQVSNFILSEIKWQVSFLKWNNRKNAPDFGMTTAKQNYYTSITCAVPKPQILGCTNSEATNYNSQATEDDGSCIIPPPKILWCTDKNSINYNPKATEDNGTCQPKIEWCTDSTAINYNPQANVHIESTCQYNTPYTPQDITGFFEKSEVQSGATTWTMKLALNMTGATLDPNSIQTWNKFTAVSATTSDKTITLTLRQFDDQRLDVECNNYEVTIPRHALTTTQGDKNPNPISGNFSVVGCEKQTNNQDPNSQNQDEEKNKTKHENTIKENNFYLSLYDTDEKGKIYLNLTNIIYLVWFLAFFAILFFVLFWFIKNSFLWRSKKSSR